MGQHPRASPYCGFPFAAGTSSQTRTERSCRDGRAAGVRRRTIGACAVPACVERSSAALTAPFHARGCRAVAVRDEPTRRSLSGHETALWELLSGPGLRVARPGQGLSRRTRLGRPVWMMSFELGLFRWPRLQLARLCCEHASVVVVRPPVLQSFYAWRRARWVLSGERSAWMCTAISVRSLSSRTVICARPVGSRRRRRRSSCSRRAWRRRTEWRSR
jgi:hypothetical protein